MFGNGVWGIVVYVYFKDNCVNVIGVFVVCWRN